MSEHFSFLAEQIRLHLTWPLVDLFPFYLRLCFFLFFFFSIKSCSWQTRNSERVRQWAVTFDYELNRGFFFFYTRACVLERVSEIREWHCNLIFYFFSSIQYPSDIGVFGLFFFWRERKGVGWVGGGGGVWTPQTLFPLMSSLLQPSGGRRLDRGMVCVMTMAYLSHYPRRHVSGTPETTPFFPPDTPRDGNNYQRLLWNKA